MVQPPPRRDASYSRKDRLYSEKLAPNPKEFRVSTTTLLWAKRAAVVVGVIIAIATAVAFMGFFDKAAMSPPPYNPKFEQAVEESQ